MGLTRSETRDLARLLALGCVAALLIASVRARLFALDEEVQNRHDVFFLPPPEQVVTMSLGYRHAFADVLWAHMLVGQGLRLREHRRFDTLLELYDTVNALDPSFRTPYVMADALITFNLIPTTEATKDITANQTLPFRDVQKAREVMERGVKALPDDAELWLTLGQFVAYVAPNSYMDDRLDEAAQWRREGVEYLKKAVELSGGNSAISWQAMGGATILREAGELDASVRFYERVYAVTDDEELRRDIEARLAVLRERRQSEIAKLDATRLQRLDESLSRSEAYRKRRSALEATILGDLPFQNVGSGEALGPPPWPAGCAGPGHHEPECATSWLEWSLRFDAQRLDPTADPSEKRDADGPP